MRLSPFFVLASATSLVAQAPSLDASLGQRLRTERPEIERLINDLQPREALKRAEALLPSAKLAFDNTDARTQVQSHVHYLACSQAYYLAFKAANASGHWEKGLDYIRKAKETGDENYKVVKVAFAKVSENFRSSGERSQAVLTEHAVMIKELKEKKNPDPGEQQTLENVGKEEKNVIESQKWAKVFLSYIETAKQDSERYDAFVAFAEKQIKDQATQIEEYKAGKGDKGKWVEAIIANPSTYASYTDKKDLLGFLYRLNVLDPDNKKVFRQIDVVLGKAAPEPPRKAGKAKPKKG